MRSVRSLSRSIKSWSWAPSNVGAPAADLLDERAPIDAEVERVHARAQQLRRPSGLQRRARSARRRRPCRCRCRARRCAGRRQGARPPRRSPPGPAGRRDRAWPRTPRAPRASAALVAAEIPWALSWRCRVTRSSRAARVENRGHTAARGPVVDDAQLPVAGGLREDAVQRLLQQLRLGIVHGQQHRDQGRAASAVTGPRRARRRRSLAPAVRRATRRSESAATLSPARRNKQDRIAQDRPAEVSSGAGRQLGRERQLAVRRPPAAATASAAPSVGRRAAPPGRRRARSRPASVRRASTSRTRKRTPPRLRVQAPGRRAAKARTQTGPQAPDAVTSVPSAGRRASPPSATPATSISSVHGRAWTALDAPEQAGQRHTDPEGAGAVVAGSHGAVGTEHSPDPGDPLHPAPDARAVHRARGAPSASPARSRSPPAGARARPRAAAGRAPPRQGTPPWKA